MEGTRRTGEGPHVVREMPKRFFFLAMAYLLALIGLFVLWHTWSDFRDWLPDELGPLPFEVPWFGALGGCLISLTGIFAHNRDWNPKFNTWHYARPLVGAVIGSIGTLIVYVLASLASETPVEVEPTVFDVAAFVIGYREASFRTLIGRATDAVVLRGDREDRAD